MIGSDARDCCGSGDDRLSFPDFQQTFLNLFLDCQTCYSGGDGVAILSSGNSDKPFQQVRRVIRAVPGLDDVSLIFVLGGRVPGLSGVGFSFDVDLA